MSNEKYDSIIQYALEQYPDYENNKTQRYNLRGFLYAMGVPQSYEGYPERARYEKIGHTHTDEFSDGIASATSYKDELTQQKIEEIKSDSGSDSDSMQWWRDWEAQQTARQQEADAERQRQEQQAEIDRWKSGNVSMSELNDRLGSIEPGQVYALLDDGTWGVYSVGSVPKNAVQARLYNGQDYFSGRQQLDQTYSDYLNAYARVTADVMQEMRREQASARVRGVDYDMSPERIQARVDAYMPKYWSEDNTKRLQQMVSDLGIPQGAENDPLFSGVASQVSGGSGGFERIFNPNSLYPEQQSDNQASNSSTQEASRAAQKSYDDQIQRAQAMGEPGGLMNTNWHKVNQSLLGG